MLQNILSKYQIILASKSPRRQELLKELGVKFNIESKSVEEVYPDHLDDESIAIYLAELKAKPFQEEIVNTNKLVITADTIVCIDNEVLGKPNDKKEAITMLQKLSGKSHEVITGVTIMDQDKSKSFAVSTSVYFKALSLDEIEYYIDNYKPFDKAGAYGIQEWIGMTSIEKIEGSYFNVVGLPIQRLYTELMTF